MLGCVLFFLKLKIPSSAIMNKISETALPFYLLHLPLLIIVSSIWFEISDSKSDLLYTLIVVPLDVLITYFLARLVIKSYFIRTTLGLSTLGRIQKTKIFVR